jgi:PEGA domain
LATLSPQPLDGGRKLLRLATRCSTNEEFFATFSRFVDETSIVILTSQPRPVGTKQPILVQLSGGEAMMRGEAEVVEVRTSPRGMMRLKLLAVDEKTRDVHRELLLRARKLAQAKSTPPPIPAEPVPPPKRATSAAEGTGQAREERAPHATYTLPANPFGELPDQALELFIECTLYEETGSFPTDGLNEIAQGTPPPSAVPQPIGAQPSTAVPMPILAKEASTAMIVPSGTFASMVPSLAQSGALQVPTILPSHPLPPKVEPMPARPLAEELRSTDEVQALLGRKRGPWAFILVTAVLAGAAGFAGGFLARESAPAPAAAPVAVPVAVPVTAPPAVVPAATPAPVPVEPVVAKAAPVAKPAKEPPPEARPPVVAAAVVPPTPASVPSGSCSLDVITEPLEVDVIAGGTRLGKTPLRAAVIPCDEVVPLVLDHPRYEKVERALRPKPGTPVAIEVRMQRPAGRVTLSSSPPGATFRVGGKSVGRGPTSSDVLSFTHVKIEAELAGYKPWSQRVYVKGRSHAVSVQLEPLRKPVKPTGPVSKPPKKGGKPDL